LWGALYWVNNAQVWPFSQGILALCSWLVVLASLIVIFQPKFSLKKLSLEVLILLLALTLRLISLANPPSMIFDEVYHSFTAKELLHNNIAAWEWWTTPPAGFAYEWTHPPIAKYGMVVGMLLFGENSFGWRIGSAIMGTISIAGIYYLAKLLTKSREIALLAMFLLSIEGLHLVQSRVGMNDAYMFCFLVWSLVFALSRHWKRAGIFFGLALASKWSALYGIIPLAIIYLEQSISTIHDLRSTIKFVFAPIRLLAISIIIYLLSFVPFLQAGHTTEQLVELHRQMWYYHTHLVATHAYQSVPWQWLTVTRPVWYFVEYGEGVKSNIYAQGNPTLLWFGLFSFFFIFFLSITSFIKSKLSRLSPNPHNLFPNFLLLALAAIFTVPWFFSPRIMFFYHYLPTASFLTILSAMVLNKLPKAWQIIFMFIFALTFVVLSPVYYGFTTSNLYWDTLFAIFPSWK
jgi:dolichyl-phosphate-mannose--protein O-mannosyl transferase